MQFSDEETEDAERRARPSYSAFIAGAGDCDSTPAQVYYSQGVERHGQGAAARHSAQHRAGEEERAQRIPHTMPGAPADPVAGPTATPSAAAAATAVGFDIETTGVGEDDILTVACVWSPTAQAICFNGDNFTPVLAMLDAATMIHTFNGIEFDLPRLAKHCGLRPAIAASWMRKTTDPLFLMRHSMGFGGCMRLNDVLTANGFEPKSGSGLQAIQFWNEGNRTALSAYCMDDARLTYELCEKRSAIVWGAEWRIHLWEPRMLRYAGGD